jgi:effector-binding domain-containing protein
MLGRLALPLALCSALACGAAWSQGAPATTSPRPDPTSPGSSPTMPPAAIITQPPAADARPAPTAPTGPSATTIPAPPPPAASAPAQPPVEQSAGLPTLVPQAGDTGDVDEVLLPAKPVAIVSGQSNWENGLKTVRASIQRVRDELAKAGLAVAGRPVTVFTETTDDGFKYDAMVPIAKAPETAPTVAADIRFGTTPSGKAYRFVHKGPYDEVDSTYETITAYLDAKDILAKDAFIEEYLNEVADPTDPSLEINIFVQPR